MVVRSPYPDVEIPEVSLYDFLFSAGFGDRGGATAFVDGVSGASLTFDQLKGMVDKIAAALAERGVAAGDVVGLFAPNTPYYAAVFHGVLRANAVVTSANSLYTPGELAHQLTDSGAKLLFTVSPFLDRATAFCNERVWGTLNATVIVDRATARDPAVRPALDRAIRELRYGTVSLNTWSAAGYGMGITPWGAYPGNPRTAIGSGTGFVHNPLMFGSIEKTVIRGPFRPFPKPPWYASHRTAHRLMPALTRFETDRHPGRLLPIAWYALRG